MNMYIHDYIYQDYISMKVHTIQFNTVLALCVLCAYVCVLSVLSDSVWDLTNHKTRTESREGSEAMRNTPPPLLHPQPLPPTTAALTPADAPTHTNCRICLTQRTHTHTNMHQTAGKRLQREAVAF